MSSLSLKSFLALCLFVLTATAPALAETSEEPVTQNSVQNQPTYNGLGLSIAAGAGVHILPPFGNLSLAYRLPVLDQSLELIGDYSYNVRWPYGYYHGAYLGARWYFYQEARLRFFAQLSLGAELTPAQEQPGAPALAQETAFAGRWALGAEWNVYETLWTYLRLNATRVTSYAPLSPELGLKISF